VKLTAWKKQSLAARTGPKKTRNRSKKDTAEEDQVEKAPAKKASAKRGKKKYAESEDEEEEDGLEVEEEARDHDADGDVHMCGEEDEELAAPMNGGYHACKWIYPSPKWILDGFSP
jgi:DNA-directed RNA polymerase delta subunit